MEGKYITIVQITSHSTITILATTPSLCAYLNASNNSQLDKLLTRTRQTDNLLLQFLKTTHQVNDLLKIDLFASLCIYYNGPDCENGRTIIFSQINKRLTFNKTA